VTINNETDLSEACHRNENNPKPLTRIYERASLVPAAAVIPALKAYIVIAAVKKLVVGSESSDAVHRLVFTVFCDCYDGFLTCFGASVAVVITLNKSKCSRQAFSLYVRAWNNGI
jgi:hypothetical protein